MPVDKRCGQHLDAYQPDIWRRANELNKQYGESADIEAAVRANEFEAKGERDGQRVWLRTLRAIDELRSVKPSEAKN